MFIYIYVCVPMLLCGFGSCLDFALVSTSWRWDPSDDREFETINIYILQAINFLDNNWIERIPHRRQYENQRRGSSVIHSSTEQTYEFPHNLPYCSLLDPNETVAILHYGSHLNFVYLYVCIFGNLLYYMHMVLCVYACWVFMLPTSFSLKN